MTVISGNVRDIGLQPLTGTLTATSVDFRADGGGALIAPEARQWNIVAGAVSVDLLPGPARITIRAGSHAHGEWDVIVPVEDVELATLIEDSIEWAPPIVSIVGEDRRRAEVAAAAAEGSASDAAGSAAAASSSAGAAASSASAAAGSASAASGSAAAAAGSAADAEDSAGAAALSASSASAGAAIVSDNLGLIEAAPGHAAAAQAARTGAESARDAAAASAVAAAGSASDAAGSATSAGSSASTATSARTAAVAARDAAVTARDAAGGHATSAESARDGAVSARDAAAGHAGSAAGHASAAAGSAAAAAGSESVAGQKATAASQSAADAAAALAQVLVELANTQAYQDVVSAIGDMSSSWNADIQAAIADLVDQAPETLDTLAEVAAALGNDPNFATTVMDLIGQKVSSTDPRLSDARPPTAHTHSMQQVVGLDDALAGKAAVGHTHTWDTIVEKPGTFASTIALVAGLQAALDGKSNTGHKHPVTDVTATGTASASTFLRGDGSWQTPPNTTYAVPTQAEAEAGTATTGRAFSAERVRQAVSAHPRVAAAPATWRWNGTALPTSAAQVHAQARVGDFIVAPNLTTDPGWHQITGV